MRLPHRPLQAGVRLAQLSAAGFTAAVSTLGPLVPALAQPRWQAEQGVDLPKGGSNQPLHWQAVPDTTLSSQLRWEPVPEDQAIDPAVAMQQQQQEMEAARPKTSAPLPFVTGGLYQVKRGSTWLPSISQRVPSGYGSTFGTLQTGLFVESCQVSGGVVCGSEDFTTQFKSQAKGIWGFLLGLGDPRKAIGVDVGFQITSLSTTRPDSTTAGTSFGSGQGLDLAISRNVSEDVSLKLGVINLIKLDDVQQGDQPSSAYGTLSARFDLGGLPEENTNDLYLTLGAANGIYRPLNVIVNDQKQTCDREVAQRGSRRQGKYIEPCLIEGFSYGDPYPVASLAYVFNPQFSLIAEWWGRNLSLAASFRPFRNINWVITPGFTNLIKNADWDPSIPGYTETPRFQLTTSIGF